jgi:hypothetical protein
MKGQCYEPIFQDEEIPEKINGVSLSLEDRLHLMNGERTGILRDMQFNNGVLRDGSVFLSRNATGEIEANYTFKKNQLQIPEEVDGYRLTKDDKTRLFGGEIVKMDTKSGVVFVAINKDLNRIVVSTPRQLGIPKEIGGYQLGSEDMTLLANGKKMPNRLFCIDGTYYTAEISLTQDKRGLNFDNYQEKSHLNKKDLNALHEQLNVNGMSKTEPTLKGNSEFQKAIEEKNFKFLIENSKNDKIVLTEKDRWWYHNNPNLNVEDKGVVDQLFGQQLYGKGEKMNNHHDSLSLKMEDHQITEKEWQKLLAGEKVAISTKDGIVLYSIDKEMNKMISLMPRQLKIPKEIYGYTLNKDDINQLANGRKMQIRLFNDQGNFFLAALSMGENKDKLFFDNVEGINSINKDKLNELSKQVNGQKINLEKHVEKINEKISGKLIVENGKIVKEDLVKQSVRSTDVEKGRDVNPNKGSTKVNEKSVMPNSFEIANPVKNEVKSGEKSIAFAAEKLVNSIFDGM